MDKRKFWAGQSVLVTGGGGFLGMWLVNMLSRLGAQVIVYDNNFLASRYAQMIKNGGDVRFVCADITDFAMVQRVLREYEVAHVFHLGAQALVGLAMIQPMMTFRSNIEGTWTVLEACRLSKFIKSVVVASSDKAYGSSDILPYQEDMPLVGRYPYDVSKACTDLVSQSYFFTYGLPVSVTRCGNFYGGGDLHFNRIVPGTIKSLLNKEKVIVRSDGKLIRDYIYVLDVVDAYLAIAENMHTKNLGGEAFNVSAQDNYNVIDLINLIAKTMKIDDFEIVIKNEAQCEIPAQYVATEKIQKMLGWTSRYTIDQALVETIVWYQAYLNNQDLPNLDDLKLFSEQGGRHATP